MSKKMRGIMYILNPFMPILAIGIIVVLLFMFWSSIKPQIAAFTSSYNGVKSAIDTSTAELNRILVDAKKHLVEAVDSSGIPDLITAYQLAIRGLDGLCGPQSGKAGYLPPNANAFLYPSAGRDTTGGTAVPANRLDRYLREEYDTPHARQSVLLRETAFRPGFSQQQFSFASWKLGSSKIKQQTKKLETGLNDALKKAGKDVEKAWEKATKEAAATGAGAVVTFSREIEKVKQEFSQTIAKLGDAAKKMVNDFGAQMDTVAADSCEIVTGPMVAVIKPVMEKSIEPFKHLDNAIEDLKKLIALQVKIKDIFSETAKMYGHIRQSLDIFAALTKRMVYLLTILLIFITINRAARHSDEIRKGWRMLSS